MKVYRDIDNITLSNSVVTIGTFDGVHKGHRLVLDRLNSAARKINGQSVVVTFNPHPLSIVAPNKELLLLSSLNEKLKLLEASGVDSVVVIPFTATFAQIGYREFVKDILVSKLGLETLLVGYDHRFGKNREGSFEMAQEMGLEFGFQVERLEELTDSGDGVSSTAIRDALILGDVGKATALLGYSYEVTGEVVSGKQLGRTIGFPTANVVVEKSKLIPKMGVYCVSVLYNDKRYGAMLNIGNRPTVTKDDTIVHSSFEVNLFNFSGDLYGAELSVSFIEYIRDEKRFDSLELLQQELELDRAKAEAILSKCQY